MRYVVMVMAMVMALTCFEQSEAKTSILQAMQRESLRELPGVLLAIEEIGQDAKGDGLLEDEVQTAVELVLRSNGIQLLNEEQHRASRSGPMLHISVTATKHPSGNLYAVAFSIQLVQAVSLVHRPETTLFVITWEHHVSGFVGSDRIREAPAQLDPIIKKFANDFLAVNPL